MCASFVRRGYIFLLTAVPIFIMTFDIGDTPCLGLVCRALTIVSLSSVVWCLFVILRLRCDTADNTAEIGFETEHLCIPDCVITLNIFLFFQLLVLLSKKQPQWSSDTVGRQRIRSELQYRLLALTLDFILL